MTVKLAVIGDVHLHFNQFDVDYFNTSDYDLILFVGDLTNYRSQCSPSITGKMKLLNKPVLFIPGNHDTTNLMQLVAEVIQSKTLQLSFSLGQSRKMTKLKNELTGIQLCGYSTHDFSVAGQEFSIVAGRPHSMGGSTLNFAPYIRCQYGITTLSESTDRLKQCVLEAKHQNLIFLAHNGPLGLGSKRNDIWGCDFRKKHVDFGDKDLTEAIAFARNHGKKVIAVVAGHMHHKLKGGGTRHWQTTQTNTLFVNAARVPRIFKQNGTFPPHTHQHSTNEKFHK